MHAYAYGYLQLLGILCGLHYNSMQLYMSPGSYITCMTASSMYIACKINIQQNHFGFYKLPWNPMERIDQSAGNDRLLLNWVLLVLD